MREALMELVALEAAEEEYPLGKWVDAWANARRALTAPDPVLPEVPPFGWFYEMDQSDNPKGGPVYLGSADQKVTQAVADDEGKRAFPLYATPPPAAQASAETVLVALTRLMPVFEKAMKGMVFTADKAGEVAADMNTLTAALAQKETPRIEGVK